MHVYEIAYTSDVLLEDCASSGKGRNLYLIYESDRVVLRRCWGHWMARNGTGEANEWAQFYATNDCRIEYSLGSYDTNSATDNLIAVAYWIASWNAAGSTNNRNVLEGSLFYGYPFHAGVWTGTQGQEQRDNVMRGNVFVGDGSALTEVFQRGGQNFTIEGNTFVNNGLGWQTIRTEGESTTIRDNSFVGGTALGLSGSVTRSGNNYHVDTIGASLAPGETTDVPGYQVQTYGIGAYLMRPAGFDRGAEILYDGQGNRLWPWPMEDRISSEMAELFGYDISPTWDVWSTLEGVY